MLNTIRTYTLKFTGADPQAQQQLGAQGPVTVRGVVRASGMFSGGTFHSAMTAMSRARQMKQASAERRRVAEQPLDDGSIKLVIGVVGLAFFVGIGMILIRMLRTDIDRSRQIYEERGRGFLASDAAVLDYSSLRFDFALTGVIEDGACGAIPHRCCDQEWPVTARVSLDAPGTPYGCTVNGPVFWSTSMIHALRLR